MPPAIDQHDIRDNITALSLAYHVRAVLRGAFILAKVRGTTGIARDSVTHLKRNVLMMFCKRNSQKFHGRE
jgi:TetR/AcrR family transcriptional regulator, transcriptional repressor for nem operon